MILLRSTRLKACGSVLLAFVGVWLGHTVEYVRVWGLAGIRAELVGSLHLYMLPVAAVLLLLTALLGARLWRVWAALGHRLDVARAALAGAWRGQRPVPPPRSRVVVVAAPSRLGGVVALWLPLAVAQVALYLLQENLEAVVAGAPAPGWGAVSGVHWAASLVHGTVALLLATLVVALGRRLHQRADTVARIENAVRSLWLRVGRVAGGCRPDTAWRPSLVDRLGAQLWSRPPPSRLLPAPC